MKFKQYDDNVKIFSQKTLQYYLEHVMCNVNIQLFSLNIKKHNSDLSIIYSNFSFLFIEYHLVSLFKLIPLEKLSEKGR